eukprot:CAMPEP_0177415462 /NCGR_PEP_ID=MMETSP0368-20130122/67581_1 /TAXON_ID=447022 ORGANISM="Scrippsiella hangoei-like, Strain SHHI-4" /NCGR_SAMPLE_ID=MMETSP0368 /ASSEMBLY_ACC=CAM_ASM_000363 /LENGTH=34 /DNA_ID= /DNA_START= /DNA_END= /DNA_ORIENTATION=
MEPVSVLVSLSAKDDRLGSAFAFFAFFPSPSPPS